MNFHHIRHHIPMSQGIIDSVMALGDSIADIGYIIACSFSSVIGNCPHSLFHKLIQVGASRMTVSKCAFHKNLRLGQILYRPSHTDFQRVIFRCKYSDFLAVQFHS